MFTTILVFSSDGVPFGVEVYGRSGSQLAFAIRELTKFAATLSSAELPEVLQS